MNRNECPHCGRKWYGRNTHCIRCKSKAIIVAHEQEKHRDDIGQWMADHQIPSRYRGEIVRQFGNLPNCNCSKTQDWIVSVAGWWKAEKHRQEAGTPLGG